MKKEKVKMRNSSIELLRIIAMLLITVSHWAVHGGIMFINVPLGFNRMLFEWAVLGNLGVIIFVIITGYFYGDKEHPINLKKIIKLWLMVELYSVGIYLLLVLFGYRSFNFEEFKFVSLPVLSREYWFFSSYILLLLLMPFINNVIIKMDKKHFNMLLFSFFICYIFKEQLLIFFRYYVAREFIDLIFFYLIGAYFKKYNDKKHVKYSYILICICILLYLVLPYVIIKYPDTFDYTMIGDYVNGRDALLLIVLGTCLFKIFSNFKEFNNKYINTIAGCVFAVYIITEQEYLRSLIWINLFKVYEFAYRRFLIVNMVYSVLITFSVCIIIELIRKYTIEKITDKLLNKIFKKA